MEKATMAIPNGKENIMGSTKYGQMANTTAITAAMLVQPTTN